VCVPAYSLTQNGTLGLLGLEYGGEGVEQYANVLVE